MTLRDLREIPDSVEDKAATLFEDGMRDIRRGVPNCVVKLKLTEKAWKAGVLAARKVQVLLWLLT